MAGTTLVLSVKCFLSFCAGDSFERLELCDSLVRFTASSGIIVNVFEEEVSHSAKPWMAFGCFIQVSTIRFLLVQTRFWMLHRDINYIWSE